MSEAGAIINRLHGVHRVIVRIGSRDDGTRCLAADPSSIAKVPSELRQLARKHADEIIDELGDRCAAAYRQILQNIDADCPHACGGAVANGRIENLEAAYDKAARAGDYRECQRICRRLRHEWVSVIREASS